MTIFTPTVTIDGTNIAGIVLRGATITRGKSDPDAPPTPSTAYLELVTADADPTVADDFPLFTYGEGIATGYYADYRELYEGGETKLAAGTPIAVTVATPTGYADTYEATYVGFAGTRFSGIVTAVDYRRRVIALTAVDSSEAIARIMVDPSSWPVEDETVRAARIATAAGITLDVVGTSGRDIVATDADLPPRSAAVLLDELAASNDALVFATRDGVLTYRTRDAVTGHANVTVPSTATIADDLTLTQELGRIVNRVTVEYGAAVSGVRPTVTVDDAPSIALYGVREGLPIVTVLNDLADATAYGNRVLDHYATLTWHMPSVAVNLALAETDTSPAAMQTIAELDLDDDVTVPYLLPAAPLLDYASRVLGYTETVDPYAWQLAISMDPAGWTRQEIPA